MIQKTQSYRVGEQFFATLEEAQEAELAALLKPTGHFGGPIAPTDEQWDLRCHGVAKFLVEHADEVVDVLTTGPNSKPTARKIHGGKKNRQATKPQEQTT